MRTGRIEAFSDGVLAIIITIMVLELHDPEGHSWHDLQHVLPTLLSYLLSFSYIGTYWVNHHHMLAATKRVTGGVLWANLALLFWLSLVPWTTSWLGSSHFAQVPAAVYGISLLIPGLAYVLLQQVIIRDQGKESLLASAVGGDPKGKISAAIYSVGIIFAFVDVVPAAMACYAVVAVMWFIPDRRVESRLREASAAD